MRWGAAVAALVALGAAWLLSCGFESRGRMLSASELDRYRGASGQPGLYLAVLGRVFDVERGRRHYGPGGAYSSLAGRDASRAFATGDFSQAGLVDDVSALSPGEMLAIHSWLTFYRDNYDPVAYNRCPSSYHYMTPRTAQFHPPDTQETVGTAVQGKLVGRFYDENGAPTDALRQAEAAIEEAMKLQAESEQTKQQFPPCNSEWSSVKGSRFWCSKQRSRANLQGANSLLLAWTRSEVWTGAVKMFHSVMKQRGALLTDPVSGGGVSRDWAGVPRKLFQPGMRGSCCVCVRTTGPPWGQPESLGHSNRGDLDNPHLEEYSGCHPQAQQCVFTP